jgi:hypothetical protein
VLFVYFGFREGEIVLKETWFINVSKSRDNASVRLTTSEDQCSKTSTNVSGRLEEVILDKRSIVFWEVTDVLKERSASIFMVEDWAKEKLTRSKIHSDYLLGLLFDPEDGGSTVPTKFL